MSNRSCSLRAEIGQNLPVGFGGQFSQELTFVSSHTRRKAPVAGKWGQTQVSRTLAQLREVTERMRWWRRGTDKQMGAIERDERFGLSVPQAATRVAASMRSADLGFVDLNGPRPIVVRWRRNRVKPPYIGVVYLPTVPGRFTGFEKSLFHDKSGMHLT